MLSHYPYARKFNAELIPWRAAMSLRDKHCARFTRSEDHNVRRYSLRRQVPHWYDPPTNPKWTDK
jgi:hypothetical protein